MSEATVQLVRYDAACRALAVAKSVDEVKQIRNLAEAMRAYAKQAKNRKLEVDAAEIRIRAERRVGELIAAQDDAIGLNRGAKGDTRRNSQRGSKLDPRPTLKEVLGPGHKHLADRARKLAALPDPVFERKITDWRGAHVDAKRVVVAMDVLATKAHVAANGGDNEWFTPLEILTPARAVLGQFDLDPASTPAANRVVKARRFFTAQDDGLARPWRGTVWVNPPYAAPLIDQFAAKLAASVAAGDVTAAIALVNNATETAWFRRLADPARAICFPEGRVKFWHPGKPTAAPLQGQAVFYFGSDITAFLKHFASIGVTWKKP